jgi:hypothetical protein
MARSSTFPGNAALRWRGVDEVLDRRFFRSNFVQALDASNGRVAFHRPSLSLVQVPLDRFANLVQFHGLETGLSRPLGIAGADLAT